MGWEGLIRVDDQTYQWMGAGTQSDVFAEQVAFTYTSIRSTFTLNVGNAVQMNVTFMSPVTPHDNLRMSLPYSYMNVEVGSLDGTSHDVQLYTDISAEWVSGVRDRIAEWDYGIAQVGVQPSAGNARVPSQNLRPSGVKPSLGTKTMAFPTAETVVPHTWRPNPGYGQGQRPTNFAHGPKQTDAAVNIKRQSTNDTAATNGTGGIAYHKVWSQQQIEFSETNQQADWGYWYYSTNNEAGLTHQSGSDDVVREQFINNGRLTNQEDTRFRAIQDEFPVFGFAVNMGQISGPVCEGKSTLFMLSLHQEACITFAGASGNVTLPCMWTNYFDSEPEAVSYFYADFEEVSAESTTFDGQVQQDSVAAGGQDYATLTTLSARQAFGTLAYVNSPDEPLVFMKEISSNGDIQTVDVIFPFHPIALYTNPDIIRYLLDPLFINQEAGLWPLQFSIHDLGFFPNATGHSDGIAENQPVEECGNMLIMVLAYYQRTKDASYLSQHYDILKQWNSFLVDEALIPENQISTDDFASSLANQTNLAIKGIIGIQAMAQIAEITGNTQDSQNFTNIAKDYVNRWMDFGIAQTSGNFTRPHTTLTYGANDTYSLLYNLYSDRLLGLDLVPQEVYDMQSDFYQEVFERYGVPLDTRATRTKSESNASDIVTCEIS